MQDMKPSLNNIHHHPVHFPLLGRNIFLGVVAIRMFSQCSSLERPSYIPTFYDVRGILENETEMQIVILAAEWRTVRTAAKSGKDVRSRVQKFPA